jgi:hypothetical protein
LAKNIGRHGFGKEKKTYLNYTLVHGKFICRNLMELNVRSLRQFTNKDIRIKKSDRGYSSAVYYQKVDSGGSDEGLF